MVKQNDEEKTIIELEDDQAAIVFTTQGAKLYFPIQADDYPLFPAAAMATMMFLVMDKRADGIAALMREIEVGE